MKDFGITQVTKKNRKTHLKYINGTFIILITICFIFFVFFSKVSNMVVKNKIDVFKEDLGQIAFYTRTFDKELSHFLITLDNIIQGYNK